MSILNAIFKSKYGSSPPRHHITFSRSASREYSVLGPVVGPAIENGIIKEVSADHFGYIFLQADVKYADALTEISFDKHVDKVGWGRKRVKTDIQSGEEQYVLVEFDKLTGRYIKELQIQFR